MLGGNPNARNNPYAPQQSWMSKQTNGARNPYGFGQQRLDGQLALQRNVPGLPTNTVPLPQVQMPQMMNPRYEQRSAATRRPNPYTRDYYRNLLGGY